LTPQERAEANWIVQEEGAQLIAWALGARPGEVVLDACAGRGAKAQLVLETMQHQGTLWAADMHPRKLEALTSEFKRFGLNQPVLAAVDWTAGQGDVPQLFQRALVDAPCTGSGTIRRRPELLLRLQPEDPARMGRLQEAIVRSVATRLLPGGRLLYAVCSVFPEECDEVVERLADILEPVAFESEVLAKLDPAAASRLRLLPGVHGTDGYFLANLRLK
jgi:16S rRNA (cytosine967-C5)-methyltransferase